MYVLNMDDSWSLDHNGDVRREARPVKRIRTTDIRPYLQDYTFFTLAPVYVYGGIACSILDHFEMEHGARDRVLVDYQRVIIQGLGRWGQFVEGIANSSWDQFCHYVTSLGFYSQQRGLYWQIYSRILGLEDPSARIIDPRKLPVRMQVFLPDGNRNRLCIVSGLPATLWWDQPQPLITEAGSRILTQHGQLAG